MNSALPARGIGMVAVASLGIASAMAHSADTSGAAGAADQTSLAEVVVTAEKRDERLQDVPVSVGLVSAESMVEQHVVSIADYLGSVPGLASNSNDQGSVNLAIRGITTGIGNPTVGITVDDVPIIPTAGLSSGLVPELDPGILDRIEVLRGPQGTLYGASSMGGLLKYVTKAPDLQETHGQVEVDGLDVNAAGFGYSVRGSITTPVITDVLAVSANAFFRRDPGYISDKALDEHGINGEDTAGGRLAVLWQINPGSTLQLAALYQHLHGDGSSIVFVNDAYRPISGLDQSQVLGTGPYERTEELYSINYNADLGWGKFTSITGYGIYSSHSSYDQTVQLGGITTDLLYPDNNYGSIALGSNSTRKLTEELRLAFSTGDHLSWVTGLFYTRELSPVYYDLYASDQGTGKLLSEVFPDSIPINTYKEYAGFADATYKFNDSFDVQLGGRYSENRQYYHEFIDGPLYSPPDDFYGPVYNVYANSKDHSLTYLLTPRFKITDDLMTYARIASGYRPGGPNPGAGFGFPASYLADTTKSYEVGIKGDAFDGRFRFDADVYYINWSKVQLSQTDPTTQFVYDTNGGKAKSQGVELTLSALPLPNLTISPTVGYTDATLTENLTGGLIGFSGDRLPYTSKWTASLDAEQKIPVSDSVGGFVGANLRYVSDHFANFSSTPGERLDMPAYALLDLRAGLKIVDWKYTLFAQNVTNRFALLGITPQLSDGSTGINFGQIQRPRTIGISVSRSF